jgi:hypothetical protein
MLLLWAITIFNSRKMNSGSVMVAEMFPDRTERRYRDCRSLQQGTIHSTLVLAIHTELLRSTYMASKSSKSQERPLQALHGSLIPHCKGCFNAEAMSRTKTYINTQVALHL